jgi:hypothetical protein
METFMAIVKHFNEGGWMMWPIAAALVATLVLVVDRCIALYSTAAIDKESFLKGLREHIYRGDLDRAISYCASQK